MRRLLSTRGSENGSIPNEADNHEATRGRRITHAGSIGSGLPKPFGALAQSRVVAVPTEFDAASVKPNREGNGVRGGCHGGDLKLTPNDAMALIPQGRCVISAGRLSHIMSIAYEFPVARIHGESSLSWETIGSISKRKPKMPRRLSASYSSCSSR